MTTTQPQLFQSTDPRELRDIIAGYCEAMLWAETDDNDEPLDMHYSFDDFAPETVEKIRDICTRFYDAVRSIAYTSEYASRTGQATDAECAGHDLWLTAGGHGVGFWETDRWLIDGEPVSGRDEDNPLCQACYAAHGQTRITGCNDAPYVGNDGMLYLI